MPVISQAVFVRCFYLPWNEVIPIVFIICKSVLLQLFSIQKHCLEIHYIVYFQSRLTYTKAKGFTVSEEALLHQRDP